MMMVSPPPPPSTYHQFIHPYIYIYYCLCVFFFYFIWQWNWNETHTHTHRHNRWIHMITIQIDFFFSFFSLSFIDAISNHLMIGFIIGTKKNFRYTNHKDLWFQFCIFANFSRNKKVFFSKINCAILKRIKVFCTHTR